MAWKIFNIGKANAEIERLTSELAAAKAATPAADSTQLADALASNDQISTQLTQANVDLATAKQTIGTLTSNLEKAQGEVNALGGSLNTACTELNLSVKEGATSGEMITSLKDGVSSTLAKLNVDSKEIPKSKPATSQDETEKSKISNLKGREKLTAAIAAQLNSK